MTECNCFKMSDYFFFLIAEFQTICTSNKKLNLSEQHRCDQLSFT